MLMTCCTTGTDWKVCCKRMSHAQGLSRSVCVLRGLYTTINVWLFGLVVSRVSDTTVT